MFLPQDHTREGERKINWSFPRGKAKYLQEVLVEAPVASFEKKQDYKDQKKNLWEHLRCDLDAISMHTASTE